MKGKRFFVSILYIVMMSLLFACRKQDNSSSKESPIAVSIVLGRHANANEFSEDSYDRILELVKKAVYGGYISVVISDGSPKKLDLTDETGKIINFDEDGKNDKVVKSRIDSRSKAVMSFLKNDINRAQRSENDLLSAIKEARASLNNKNAVGLSEKYILILDSGISTAGELKFQNIDFSNEKKELPIKKIVKELKEKTGILPDLEGINIQFIGLGDAAYPQRIDDTNKVNVKRLWEHLLKACGAKISDKDILVAGLGDDVGINTGDKPNLSVKDDGSGGNFPTVTPIQFISVDMKFGDTMDGGEVFNSGDGIPTDALGFKANSSEYIDEGAAVYILKPYAKGIRQFLKKNPKEKIYLVGSVAITKEGDYGDFKLSRERAEKVKGILVENYNLPKERFITIGLGGVVPWRVNEFVNGKFIEDLAANNRAVWVLKASSSKYGEIPNKYKK